MVHGCTCGSFKPRQSEIWKPEVNMTYWPKPDCRKPCDLASKVLENIHKDIVNASLATLFVLNQYFLNNYAQFIYINISTIQFLKFLYCYHSLELGICKNMTWQIPTSGHRKFRWRVQLPITEWATMRSQLLKYCSSMDWSPYTLYNEQRNDKKAKTETKIYTLKCNKNSHH